MRWSNERYLALVESGVIEEGLGVEGDPVEVPVIGTTLDVATLFPVA